MSNAGLVQRASGIVVAADVAAAVDEARPEPKHETVYDLDGRRRVVLSDDVRRRFDREVRELLARGIGFLLVCREDVKRDDGKPSCGQPMQPQRNDSGGDFGYGCRCTRIHFATWA
jgi:hypothetical protein